MLSVGVLTLSFAINKLLIYTYNTNKGQAYVNIDGKKKTCVLVGQFHSLIGNTDELEAVDNVYIFNLNKSKLINNHFYLFYISLRTGLTRRSNTPKMCASRVYY